MSRRAGVRQGLAGLRWLGVSWDVNGPLEVVWKGSREWLVCWNDGGWLRVSWIWDGHMVDRGSDIRRDVMS